MVTGRARRQAMGRLSGRRVVVFIEEGFEDLEFWVTLMRLREEGAEVTIAGTRAGKAYRGKNALSASSDVAVADVSTDDFDAIVVPGGWAPESSAGTKRSPASSARPTTKERSSG
jgi:putative intracellular protease/amidase